LDDFPNTAKKLKTRTGMESPSKPPVWADDSCRILPCRQGAPKYAKRPCRKAGFFVGRLRLRPTPRRTLMQEAFQIAALWLGLAVLSTIIASHLRISMALVEICVGMAAAFVAHQFIGADVLEADQDWLRFIASIGAVLLTFL